MPVVPPVRSDFQCPVYKLPDPLSWVYVCLKGQAGGGCCAPIVAQWFPNGNDCETPGTNALPGVLCDQSNACWMIPIPSCTTPSGSCNVMFVPWYEVAKWASYDTTFPCGTLVAPASFPCTLPV